MKIVVGSWLVCAPTLVGCVDKESQGVGTETDGSAATTGLPGTGSVEPGVTTGADTSVNPSGGGGGTEGGTGDGTGSEDTSSMPGGTGTGDTTGSVQSGCQKIDLLFVIDNSSTMGAEQQSLIAAFPAFYDGLGTTLGVSDYHIMAVAADDGKILGNNSKCKDKACTCGPAPACCDSVCKGGNFADSCNGQACDTFELSECVYTYGAGRDYNTDGTFCNLADGRRYMNSSQADVPGTFACIASAGTYDNVADKKPMLAAQEAVSPTQNGAGACNEGFLRDDAILVLVFVSDKDDANHQNNSGSPGEPADWYNAIVAAKGGDAAKVVVLGLVGDGNMPAGVCAPEDEPDMMAQIGAPAPRLQEFVGMFPHASLGSVCAPDYAPFFTAAVSIVEQACDALPPGP